MKKLLLAVAVSVAAGSASAATIYEGKGLTYKINGDLQIQLREKINKDNDEADIEFDDLEIKNYVSYDLGNDMTAFGRVDFGFKDAANDDPDEDDVELEEAYLGLTFGNASVSFGKQNFASDEFGIEEAYELNVEDRFDSTGTDGDDTIRMDIEWENAYLAVSYEIDAEGADSSGEEYFDIYASTEFGNLTLAAAYQTFETSAVDKKIKIARNKVLLDAGKSYDTWGVSASYDAGFATFAADYSDTDEIGSQYNIAAVFAAAETTDIAIGMLNEDPDAANTDDVTEWYANVTYKFPTQKNVSIFAEIADTDADNYDMGYLAGMRVKF